ncbi:caspase family protein [Leptolyngbya ohadii]|uniref:caspase family protein n=1 Tax=Leptolyngbya ohadii TaxID=1962290 RepID=UPI000B59E88B|nr:caspase family protein [Leptolyngbya ohadii]
MTGQRYLKSALLIGVSEYDSSFNPLPSAVRDVTALHRVLKHSDMGSFDEVEQLLNPNRQIMEERIETWFRNHGRDDLLLLFFSGHGVIDENGKLYLATTQTRKDRGGLITTTAVAASTIHECMKKYRSKRQVIILDCCFSGAFAEGWSIKNGGSLNIKSELGAEGRVVLTSSTSTQYSFEQTSGLSIYTQYLVEGIETGAADRDKDGLISVDELHEYASSKVHEAAPSMSPKIIVLKDEGFKILIAKAPVNDPGLIFRREVENRVKPIAISATGFRTHGISKTGRKILDQLRDQLGLEHQEARRIEASVLEPLRIYERKLYEYEQAHREAIELEYPLLQHSLQELKRLQQILGLRDQDIELIATQLEIEYCERSEEYQKKLQQYEKTFLEAGKKEYPFSYYTRQILKKLQKELLLSDQDVEAIEARNASILDVQKRSYQQNLQQYERAFAQLIARDDSVNDEMRQQLKQLQLSLNLYKEDIDILENKVASQIFIERREYQRKLTQYEQEFSKLAHQGFPLSSSSRNQLIELQRALNLKNEDIIIIEGKAVPKGSSTNLLAENDETLDNVLFENPKPKPKVMKFLRSILDDN